MARRRIACWRISGPSTSTSRRSASRSVTPTSSGADEARSSRRRFRRSHTGSGVRRSVSMQRRWWIELALVLLLFVVAAVAFTQSYQRWLDPIIDTGRDLYIPGQIDQGARLYRDIRYQYPPLA